MNNTIVIRTDGAQHIGTGHVYRCLTLANYLKKRSFTIIFVMVNFDHSLIELVKSFGFSVISLNIGDQPIDLKDEKTWLGTNQELDAFSFLDKIKDYQPVCCIVDHYSLDEKWENIVSTIIPVMVVIDDLANRSHVCDILLDQNYWPNFKTRYEHLVATNCIQLLGPTYCLLREEFLELRIKKKQKKDFKQILVNFGGIGNAELLKKVCNAISHFPNYQFIIITGKLPNNQFFELKNYFQEISNHISMIEKTDNLAQLMHASDFSLGASGSTVWERFCLGLNSALLAVADNQIQLLHYLATENLIDDLGCIENITTKKLVNYIQQLNTDDDGFAIRKQSIMSLVDGKGANRVSEAIVKFVTPSIKE